MATKYVVFEDLQSRTAITGHGDSPVKIHAETCHFYQDRNPRVETVRWTGQFAALSEAEAYASQTNKPWKRALCCF